MNLEFLDSFVDEALKLYAELAEYGALAPFFVVYLASTVLGIAKAGIKFLLIAAIVLFALTSLGIVVL